MNRPSAKKLVLARITLRRLDAAHLRTAGGGMVTTTTQQGCSEGCGSDYSKVGGWGYTCLHCGTQATIRY